MRPTAGLKRGGRPLNRRRPERLREPGPRRLPSRRSREGCFGLGVRDRRPLRVHHPGQPQGVRVTPWKGDWTRGNDRPCPLGWKWTPGAEERRHLLLTFPGVVFPKVFPKIFPETAKRRKVFDGRCRRFSFRTRKEIFDKKLGFTQCHEKCLRRTTGPQGHRKSVTHAVTDSYKRQLLRNS